MEGEIWKDVVGYEGLYEISNYGRIKSLPVNVNHSRGNGMTRPKNERILKQVLSKRTGYLRMCLCKENKKKSYQMHRLIAIAFIPNPQNKPCINHINGVKHDNSLKNLEWVTVKENNIHKFTHLGHVSGRKNKISNTIYKYTFDGELVDVIKDTWDVDPKYKHNVMNVCFGYNNSFDNHTWSFKPIKEIDKRRFGQGKYQQKPVYQKSTSGDLIEIHKSLQDASIKCGISKSTISNCLRGDTKVGRGYVWSYSE